MKYKNIKTQAVIETACVINGGDWEMVEEQPATISELTSTSASESESDSVSTSESELASDSASESESVSTRSRKKK